MFKQSLFIFIFLLAISEFVIARQLTDPTRPSVQVGDSESPSQDKADNPLPVLQGVMKRNGKQYALIEGQLLTVGSQVQNYRITSIRPNRVVIVANGEKVELSLHQGLIKQQSKRNK